MWLKGHVWTKGLQVFTAYHPLRLCESDDFIIVFIFVNLSCDSFNSTVKKYIYLLSIGRLYSSQSQALVWGVDRASPQLTALCFGIFGARVPFFWFWLPERWEKNIKVNADLWLASLKFTGAHSIHWPYRRCCCCLCQSCGVSLLCCDHGSGCRGSF